MRIFFLLLLQLAIISCQTRMQNNSAKISFDINEYNMGDLELNENTHCNFNFLNSGNSPLIIQNVKTSCGCTIPKYSMKPIKPGDKGSIEIRYDTSLPGAFNKTIKVYFNGNNSPVELKIKGRVEYPDNRETN